MLLRRCVHTGRIGQAWRVSRTLVLSQHASCPLIHATPPHAICVSAKTIASLGRRISTCQASSDTLSPSPASTAPASAFEFVVGLPEGVLDGDDFVDTAAGLPVPRLPFYAAYPLKREASLRSDPKALAKLFTSPNARLLPVEGSRLILQRQAPPSIAETSPMPSPPPPAGGTNAAVPPSVPLPLQSIVFIEPASAAPIPSPASAALVFLGLDMAGRPYFAADVGEQRRDYVLPEGAEWRAVRLAGPELSPGEAALAATATSLCCWNSNNTHHSGTGSLTVPAVGGYARECSTSGRKVYPRIDPAVIMLVTCGDYCLLGRNAKWAAGRYSTLSGFLDVGETLEQAVVREVNEEAGVRVALDSVRYRSSQPWPFPQSLMLGFFAEADPSTSSEDTGIVERPRSSGGDGGGTVGTAEASGTGRTLRPSRRGLDLLGHDGRMAAIGVGITPAEVESALLPWLQVVNPDYDEIADAQWFHRDWLAKAVAGEALPDEASAKFHIPGHYSLAYRLITDWLASDSVAPGWRLPAAVAQALPQVAAQVRIDADGVFKYVLLRVSPEDDTEGRSQLLVWGDARAGYHNDLYLRVKKLVGPYRLAVEPLGGGRIEHDASGRQIRIFGYSSAFGPAPHEITAALVRRNYPLYGRAAVSISYEGY